MPHTERTVVCLKWGDRYSAKWVNLLYKGVKNNLKGPFHFVCFTEDPKGIDAAVEVRDLDMLKVGPEIDGIWCKLGMLHPQAQLSGRCLYIDLDSLITGPLDDFFSYSDQFCIIHNWIERRKQIFRSRPKIGNSSVVSFDAGAYPDVAESFCRNPEHATDRRFFPTEQAYMTHAVGVENITWWPETWVRSFKRHCVPVFPLNYLQAPKLPEGTRILTFHGTPKQDQVTLQATGHGHKFSRAMPELKKYWQ
ncbi:MAG: hypothetical protein ACR2PW_01270 [Gammaproteobacteria bacterium]